jgi:tetratricopeptide (TPR) repeat protein
MQSLRRQLRGDLDWITLKAMDKDRARRYASASELAADIERHLAGEPLLARPPGVGYRLGKFVARHRFAVAAGALVAVALVLGIAGTSVGLMRARRAEAKARRAGDAAEREAAQAKAVNDFLREVLSSADARQQGRDVKVVDALKKAVERIESGAGLRPELEAAVRTSIGATYQNLGELELAEKQIRAGLAIRLRALGPEDPDTLTSQNALLEVLQAAGRIEEALEVGRQTLALRRKVLGAEHPETTVTMNDLSVALSRAGQDDEAEQLLREAVAIRERVLGPDDARTLVATGNLANLLGRRGKRAEALETTRRVLEAQRRILGPEHSNTVYTLTTYAGLLYDEGKLEEAEPIYREAITASRRVSGSRHVDTLILANDLGLLLLDRGKLAEAEALLREAAQGAQATLPPGHVFTAGFRRNLGRCLTKAGRYREAESELLAAHAALQAAGGEGRRASEAVVKRLVELYDAWGKRAKAAAYRKQLPSPS